MPKHLRKTHGLKGRKYEDALLAVSQTNEEEGTDVETSDSETDPTYKPDEVEGTASDDDGDVSPDGACSTPNYQPSDDDNDRELSAEFSDEGGTEFPVANHQKVKNTVSEIVEDLSEQESPAAFELSEANQQHVKDSGREVCEGEGLVPPFSGEPAMDDEDDEDYDYEDNDDEDYVEEESDVPEPKPLKEAASQEIINKFRFWLESADGGLKNPKSAKQHVSQIVTLLLAIDEEENVLCVLDKSLLLDKFLEKHAKDNNYTPGTIKSYLMSARHFCTFLLSSERILDSELTVEQKQRIDVVAETLKRWSASYRKLSNKRMLEKMDKDIENLVTPEKVAKFEKSDTAREVVKILGKLSADGEVEITQTVFVTIRDFLITQIILANANRSGVISNMTVGEFA